MLDFSDEYESSNLTDANENPPISANLLPVKNIDSALESKQSFDRMFVVLANKAAQSFRSAEKERSVAKVTSSIGQLHLYANAPVLCPCLTLTVILALLLAHVADFLRRTSTYEQLASRYWLTIGLRCYFRSITCWLSAVDKLKPGQILPCLWLHY
jgi:type II secretory pathway component PulK